MSKENRIQGSFYRLYGKRAIDLVLAILLSAPSFLIVLVCCLLIKLKTKGPVFFVQERPGRHGRIFRIIKLRTMIVETHSNSRLLSDMERMTGVGKVIRACSFDELPQIWNILIGEMSFIGPRPLLPAYLPLYTREQMRRHDVLPGISGWAQANGRNELSWEEKFDRDLWYVDNINFRLDVKILWMTLANVLRRRGVNASSNDTMQDFVGTDYMSTP